MKTRGMFKALGSRVIGGRRVVVAEHKHLSFYRIGTCNIPAANVDAAIAKYVECQARRQMQNAQRTVHNGQPPLF